jgi:hypothetical protein
MRLITSKYMPVEFGATAGLVSAGHFNHSSIVKGDFMKLKSPSYAVLFAYGAITAYEASALPSVYRMHQYLSTPWWR